MKITRHFAEDIFIFLFHLKLGDKTSILIFRSFASSDSILFLGARFLMAATAAK
jgi:hypothetical protein